MKISELIKELEKIKEREGDIDALIREYVDDNESFCGDEDPWLTVTERVYKDYDRTNKVIRVKQVVL